MPSHAVSHAERHTPALSSQPDARWPSTAMQQAELQASCTFAIQQGTHPCSVRHLSFVESKNSCRLVLPWLCSYSVACKIISSLSKSLHSCASGVRAASYSCLQVRTLVCSESCMFAHTTVRVLPQQWSCNTCQLADSHYICAVCMHSTNSNPVKHRRKRQI